MPLPSRDDWSYDGATGPAHWSDLSEAYASCDGDAQSPVDIAAPKRDGALPPLDVSYAKVRATPDRDQHVTTLRVENGPGLTFGAERYALVEFHFHTPSEHTLAGRSFAAEAHFVHEGSDGPAVLAVLLEASDAENPALAQVLEGRAETVALGALLPSDEAYYTYTGSLTTPPCTEGVRWFVLQQPVAAAREQIDRLKGEGTNRPVQPLNGRTVAANR